MKSAKHPWNWSTMFTKGIRIHNGHVLYDPVRLQLSEYFYEDVIKIVTSYVQMSTLENKCIKRFRKCKKKHVCAVSITNALKLRVKLDDNEFITSTDSYKRDILYHTNFWNCLMDLKEEFQIDLESDTETLFELFEVVDSKKQDLTYIHLKNNFVIIYINLLVYRISLCPIGLNAYNFLRIGHNINI